MSAAPLSWIGILRLGLVQTALGAIVVLTTSTLNRVMVVELLMPAMLPGALVAFHYAIQMLRPRWGYGSDVAGRRTPWIVGGMAVLALGAATAAVATAWMGLNPAGGIALAVLAFALIGGGVGASGTNLLALLATRVAPDRRAAAATLVWLMMIAGMAMTAGLAGQFLDPFSASRLVAVTTVVAGAALLLTVFAVWRVEAAEAKAAPEAAAEAEPKPAFREALAEVWADPRARGFSIFVFVSMLAYSAQDLILEPFAGLVFGLTPGQSTQLAGIQHSGILLGMILVAVAGSVKAGGRFGSLRTWTVGGCLASAVALLGLALAGFVGPAWPLRASVFFLGFANGVFAVAAIGSMLGLAAEGTKGREGIRMGLWGAAQAVAFGLGGFLGTAGVDAVRFLDGSPLIAYSAVFALEAAMFVVSAGLAARIAPTGSEKPTPTLAGRREGLQTS